MSVFKSVSAAYWVDSTLHPFNEWYRICTSNTNSRVALLTCKYCRITHVFPFLCCVCYGFRRSQHHSLSKQPPKKKTPSGMRKEIQSQQRFSEAFLLCWLLFDSAFPRVVVLRIVRSLLDCVLSFLFFSPCPQHLLKVRYGNNFPLCTI